MQLHWDGNNTKVEERNRSAAFGTGATPPTLDRPRIQRIEAWLLEKTPPPYPYAIDRTLAERGAEVYGSYCAGCHGANGRNFSGDHVGKVTPIREVDGTVIGKRTPGLVTEEIQRVFFAATSGIDQRYKDWLHPIDVGAVIVSDHILQTVS